MRSRRSILASAPIVISSARNLDHRAGGLDSSRAPMYPQQGAGRGACESTSRILLVVSVLTGRAHANYRWSLSASGAARKRRPCANTWQAYVGNL